MAKYKVSLGIGFANAVHRDVIEIDDGELEQCTTEAEKDDLIQSYWQDWANNYIDGGIYPDETDA